MSNFSCNKREKKEYEKMKKRFQKMSGSDSFDMDLCLADMYAGVTRMLKKHYISLSNARFSKENYDDVLRSVLKSLMNFITLYIRIEEKLEKNCL